MTIEDLNREPHFAECYTSHKVFERLSAIQDFYDTINMTSSSCTDMPLTSNIGKTLCVLFSSIKGTIESIFILLKHGHCNDAFALIRKYSDAIIIDTYKSILIKETYAQFFNDVSWEVIVKNKVSEWIEAKSPLMDMHPKKEFQEIKKAFPQLMDILDLKSKKNKPPKLDYVNPDSEEEQPLYCKIRSFCNDNVHYNSFGAFLWNDPDFLRCHIDISLKLLNNVYSCMTFLSSMHFAFLYELHPEYFMAADYIDYLERGEQPPLGSEYWVAPGLQDFFTRVVYPYNNNKLGKYLISLDKMNLTNGTEQDK